MGRRELTDEQIKERFVAPVPFDGRCRHECDECGTGSLCDPTYTEIDCFRYGCEGTMEPVRRSTSSESETGEGS